MCVDCCRAKDSTWHWDCSTKNRARTVCSGSLELAVAKNLFAISPKRFCGNRHVHDDRTWELILDDSMERRAHNWGRGIVETKR